MFFTQLANHAGYTLDSDLFTPGKALRDEFVWARFHNQATGRTDRLAAVLDQAITPTEHTARIHREALRAVLEQRQDALAPNDEDIIGGGRTPGPYRSGPRL